MKSVQKQLFLLGIIFLFCSLISIPSITRAADVNITLPTDPDTIWSAGGGGYFYCDWTFPPPDDGPYDTATWNFTLTKPQILTLFLQGTEVADVFTPQTGMWGPDTVNYSVSDYYLVYIDGILIGQTSTPAFAGDVGFGSIGNFLTYLKIGTHHLVIQNAGPPPVIPYPGASRCDTGFYMYGRLAAPSVCHGIPMGNDPSHTVCCGDPTSPNSIIYDPSGGLACCGTESSNPLIYDPSTGADCCGEPDSPNVKIFYPFPNPKKETCCPGAANSVTVCNGCKICATTIYQNLFAPTGSGSSYATYHCSGTIPFSIGTCIDNCEGCKQCADDAATGGKICKDTAQILTQAYYSAHPTDTHPADGANLYSCSCQNEGTAPPYLPGDASWGSACFYYGPQSFGGLPLWDGCPTSGSLDTKTNKGCMCTMPDRCKTFPGDQCESAPCETLGLVYAHSSIITGGTSGFYPDCPNPSYCCAPPQPPTPTHCGGPYNLFCLETGTGKACSSIWDCWTPPTCPTSAGQADANAGQSQSCGCGGQQTCLADGTWSSCTSFAGQNKSCGCGGQQTCQTNGTWSSCTVSTGQTQSCQCGGGAQQTCQADGTWSPACPSSHTNCLNGTCQCVSGSGQDGCVTVGSTCSCTSGQTQSCGCGGQQTCDAGGAWSTCTIPTGQTQSCSCGGTQTCQSNGSWSNCPYHTSCLSGTCQCVTGSGSDACPTIGQQCCIPIWTYGEWSTCVNNWQTRINHDSAGCFGDTTDGRYCSASPSCTNNLDCSSGQQCFGGICCTPSQACNGTCLTSGQTCCDSVICPSDSQCISGICCDSSQICNGACLPADQSCCSGSVCSSGKQCIDGTCCNPYPINICNPLSKTCTDTKSVCSGSNACAAASDCNGCSAGNVPCPNTSNCCPTASCCGGACLASGQICCNGAVCSAGSQCVSGVCCASDQVCGSSCLPDGSTCCNGLACPSGSQCAGGLCVLNCTSNSDCPLDQQCVSGSCHFQNLPPTADSLSVDEGPYCAYSLTGIPASGLATFQWTYRDQEADAETTYQLQISLASGSDFNANIIYDTGYAHITAATGAVNKVLVPVLLASTNPPTGCMVSPTHSTATCNFINYGVAYYWRVRVWEAKTGFNSSYVSYIDTHTFLASPNNYIGAGYSNNADDKDSNRNTYTYIYAHPSPAVNYTPPSSVAPTQLAIFTDISRCYGDNGNSYICKTMTPTECTANATYNGVSSCYGWWFEDINKTTPDDTVVGNSSHTFAQVKRYSTKLRVCDNIGCCSSVATINVGASGGNVVPSWWEVSPY